MHIENTRMSQSDSESWARLADDIRATCAAMTQAGIALIQPDAITLSETTLGDGANGTVYLGKITTRADVAIKLVTATGIKSARASLFDFQNEMQMNHLATNEIRQGRPSRMAETICGEILAK